MADRRYIAQSITDSGQVEQLVRHFGGHDGFWAATLFSWLIPFIDDDHRLIGKPDALRSKVFARYADIVSEDEVAEALALMNDIDLLQWYEVVGSPGERYLYSPKFSRHQTLRADRYTPSRFPAPPGWTPDEDHPYGKNPDLRKAKPQRDNRRTVRIGKRPINKGQNLTLATSGDPSGQPEGIPQGNQPEPRKYPGGDEASRHVTSPHPTSRHVSAVPPHSEGTGELRSGDGGTSGSAHGLDRQQIENEEKALAIMAAADGLWQLVLEGVRQNLPLHTFVSFFEGARLEQRAETYYVVAPNAFAAEWLGTKYLSLLRASLGVVLQDVSISVKVVEQAEVPALADVAP